MTDRPIRPDYESTTLRITDLAVTEDYIRNKVFSNCQLIGPAILAPVGCNFAGGVFEVANNDPWSVLLVIPPGPRLGVIAAIDCEFYNCRFTRIGFALTQADAEDFVSAIRP